MGKRARARVEDIVSQKPRRVIQDGDPKAVSGPPNGRHEERSYIEPGKALQKRVLLGDLFVCERHHGVILHEKAYGACSTIRRDERVRPDVATQRMQRDPMGRASREDALREDHAQHIHCSTSRVT